MLRALVARLEAQVQSLTSQLAVKRGGDVQEPGQPKTPSWQAPGLSAAGSSCSCQDHARNLDTTYRGRILRPTFAKPGHIDHPGETLWSSPWHLWGNDTEVERSPNAVDPASLLMETYAIALIDKFFTCRWPQLPILHRGVFMQRHYAPLAAGLPAEPLSSFQVNMVFAIACADTGPADERQQFSHHDFFQIAVRDLHLVLTADDLQCIQCLLLLCLYGCNEPQWVNLWYTIGLALRLALGIDLHRSETIAHKGVFEAEMSKRLFWSIYVMDRSMSIAMGRPLGILDADITTPLPLCLTDEQISSNEGTAAAENTVCQVDDMSTFIHVIKLRRINADIYKTFHVAGNRDMDHRASEILRAGYYNQLNEWLVAAPRYLPSASMFQTPEWFHIAYHQGVMSLYRPSYGTPSASTTSTSTSSAAATPSPSADGLRLCVDSSLGMISCYRALRLKNRVVYTFVALNSIFMAAVTLLYALRAAGARARADLGRPAVEAAVAAGLDLLHALAGGRAVGARCARIVRRLGAAVFDVFDQQQQQQQGQQAVRGAGGAQQVDAEFLAWFGLKCQTAARRGAAPPPPPGGDGQTLEVARLPTLSVDTAWNDLIDWSFDVNGAGHIEFFL